MKSDHHRSMSGQLWRVHHSQHSSGTDIIVLVVFEQLFEVCKHLSVTTELKNIPQPANSINQQLSCSKKFSPENETIYLGSTGQKDIECGCVCGLQRLRRGLDDHSTTQTQAHEHRVPWR